MSRIELGSSRHIAPAALPGPPARAGRAAPAPTAHISAAAPPLDPGAPPVDAERVAQIRKAIEQGTYPLLPSKVADAMIAAGVLLARGNPA